jgi:hypothetical protein
MDDRELQWISIKDRLPKPETDVLVRYLRHGFMEAFDVAGIFCGEWMSAATEEDTRGEVTHWMPIPPVSAAAEIGKSKDQS